MLCHALGHGLRTHLLALGSLLVRSLDVIHLEDINPRHAFHRSRKDAFLGRRSDGAYQTGLDARAVHVEGTESHAVEIGDLGTEAGSLLVERRTGDLLGNIIVFLVPENLGANLRSHLIDQALVRLSRVQAWEPADKTLGIVGVGHVGSLVEAYARTWGFRVVACDPPREEREHGGFLPLEEGARQADILTFHTPLDDTTRHMAGAKLFERMKPGSILINTSRGEVVDGQALRESGLQYVLDVWEHEPDLDPPLLRNALLATPHIAGYSAQGKANATALSVRTISRYFGLPLGEWYPSNIAPSRPRAISWQELCDTIDDRFDIAAESRRLKENPEKFETIRNEYRYREEYF